MKNGRLDKDKIILITLVFVVVGVVSSIAALIE